MTCPSAAAKKSVGNGNGMWFAGGLSVHSPTLGSYLQPSKASRDGARQSVLSLLYAQSRCGTTRHAAVPQATPLDSPRPPQEEVLISGPPQWSDYSVAPRILRPDGAEETASEPTFRARMRIPRLTKSSHDRHRTIYHLVTAHRLLLRQDLASTVFASRTAGPPVHLGVASIT